MAHDHNVVYMQMFDVVERSMCPNHFEKFKSFHENIYEFCSSVSLGKAGINKTVFGYFRNRPARVKRLDWVKFGDWVKNGEGVKFSWLCGDWSDYAQNSIKAGEGCRNVSMRLINFDKVIEFDDD
ncbi:hypothetical protein FRX31_019526 [Thalictrum thalictroides]|uniref:Uncharacterized protein n=1 Tax=Thalictrum thalictroides TaxID=46969 RepID=A0A7J6W0G7_THATH|nr:hypothetical protein FRX31_019526 [Thalictrum thalictroides]